MKIAPNTFEEVCAILVCRGGYNAGQSVTEIAKLTGKSTKTIRCWLEKSGLAVVRERKPA